MFKKECCKQCRHVKFKGTMTKQEQHKKHAEHQDATDIQKKHYFFRKLY